MRDQYMYGYVNSDVILTDIYDSGQKVVKIPVKARGTVSGVTISHE